MYVAFFSSTLRSTILYQKVRVQLRRLREDLIRLNCCLFRAQGAGETEECLQ